MNDPLDDLLGAALEEGPDRETGTAAGSAAHRTAFTESVMSAVRAQALPPLPFPWRRVGLGAALAAGAALLTATLPAGGWTPFPSGDAAAWLAPLAVVLLFAPRILAAVAGDGS